MNHRTVDFNPTVASLDFLEDASLLSVSDSVEIAKQFPLSPIIGSHGGSPKLTANEVARLFRSEVMRWVLTETGMVDPDKVNRVDPTAAAYWGFTSPSVPNLAYHQDGKQSLPEYDILGHGSGDPLNSFVPNLMSPSLNTPFDPLNIPQGWDEVENTALLRKSIEMVDNLRGSSFGSGPGTELSPYDAARNLAGSSPWRGGWKVNAEDVDVGMINWYEMGSSGMTDNHLEFDDMSNPVPAGAG